tara:strand:+ start:329 stop:949 length:621 start_codon:yes stop_codon:yes gene_type:complete
MSIIKLNNQGVKNATAFGSITGLGSMTFIKKLTASSSSTLSFVDGASSVVLDNTYKEYVFTFKNIHPSADGSQFLFNLSADTGSNYNVTKTTTAFRAYHAEDDSATGLGYYTGGDLAQSTDFQRFADSLGNDNDQSLSGTFTLFNPSSTTFVKHFIANVNYSYDADYSLQYFMAGYGNTTSAVDAVQFKMSSGNIDAGDICLYGIA